MNATRALALLALAALAAVPAGCTYDEPAEIPGFYTQGEYMGHEWYIDEHHMIFWDEKPYVRYGFTGNPSVEQVAGFVEMGINHFSVVASEETYVFATDPTEYDKAVSDTDAFAAEVSEQGGTYYAGLNTLLPWKTTGKIDTDSRVPWIERGFTDVSEFRDSVAALTLEVTVADDLSDYANPDDAQVLLFDFDAPAVTDLTGHIVSIGWEQGGEPGEDDQDAKAENDDGDEPDGGDGLRIVIELEDVSFPDSKKLFATATVPTTHETVFTYDLPAMWKPGVLDYFEQSLERFAEAYRKKGLRGMLFGDEVSLWDNRSFMWDIEDFNRDADALAAWRLWLATTYQQNIAALNNELGTAYTAFDEVPWTIQALPYEGLEDLAAVGELFGLYDEPEQVEAINRLQNDFRYDFYGSWYAHYADLARQAIGNVPVFTTIWATANANGHEHDIHRQAMIHGTDGLVRNSYGTVAKSQELGYQTIGDQDLEGIENYLKQTAIKADRTKAYLANEFYWTPKMNDDEADAGLPVFQFLSRDDMQAFLTVMVDYGYTGFHLFIMNPGEVWDYEGEEANMQSTKQDMMWFLELKEGAVAYATARY